MSYLGLTNRFLAPTTFFPGCLKILGPGKNSPSDFLALISDLCIDQYTFWGILSLDPNIKYLSNRDFWGSIIEFFLSLMKRSLGDWTKRVRCNLTICVRTTSADHRILCTDHQREMCGPPAKNHPKYAGPPKTTKKKVCGPRRGPQWSARQKSSGKYYLKRLDFLL